MRRVIVVVLAAIAGLAALAWPRMVPDRDTLRFALSGCDELPKSGVCESSAGSALHIFVEGVDTIEVDAPHTALVQRDEKVEGGRRLSLLMPAKNARLTLRHGNEVGTVGLVLVAVDPVIDRARALRSQGAFDEAGRALAPLVKPGADARRRVRAESLLARLSLSRGAIERAMTELEAAAREAEALGLRRQAAVNWMALGDTAHDKAWDIARARAAFGRVSDDLPEDAAWAEYHRGVLALVSGRASRALTHIERAERRAGQLGLDALRSHAMDLRVQVLAELGELERGRAWVERLHREGESDACARARQAVNEGWLELAAQGSPERALAASERGLIGYERDCPSPAKIQNALINVGLAHTLLSHDDAARTALTRAATLGPMTGWVFAWKAELEARLSMAEGRLADAEKLYRELLDRSATLAPVASRYRALLGLGRVAHAQNDHEAAIIVLEQAELLLDEEIEHVPFGELRETFVGQRRDSATLLVELLLAQGRPAQALEVARRARARPLRTLALRSRIEGLDDSSRSRWDARVSKYRELRRALETSEEDAWKLPLDELGATTSAQESLRSAIRAELSQALETAHLLPLPLYEPTPDTLTLLFFPLGESAVITFAEHAGEVQAVKSALTDRSADALSRSLLLPFAREIAQSERLRLLSMGWLTELDLHALPFAGRTLMEAANVSYGLDLQVEAGALVPGALVVADARGDLPSAREEGTRARDLLARTTPTTLLAGESATREATLAALERVGVFHFAGHGEVAGASGIGNRLLLSGLQTLETQDVLATSHVPHTVVLSACDTALPERITGAGLSMTHAFMLRGASLVLSSTRPLRDRTLLDLVSMVYTVPPSHLTERTLIQAVRSLHSQSPLAEEWLALRIHTP